MDDNLFECVNQTGNKEEDLTTHPLLIPVIMDRIINYLPFQVLKACRSISKLWNETVTSSKQFKLKSRNFVQFGCCKRYDMINTRYSLDLINQLGDCIRSPLRTINFPLHTFIVATSQTVMGSNMTESTLANFLNAISPVSQKIVIQYDCKFVSTGKIGAMNWSLFPKLKYLKLKLGELQPEIILQFLEHLMGNGNAPQLEKLHIRWESWEILDSSLSNLISTINVPTTISKLKSLKMKCPFELQDLIEFKALKLNLKDFHIEVKNISHLETASTLRSILEKLSKTLCRFKIINLDYHDLHTKVDIFPKMSNLETLIIGTPQIIFANNLLKERFPRLKSLIFTGTASPWNEFIGEEIEPILSINEIGVNWRLRDEAILLKAIQYFPIITKLQIPALSNMTEVVFDKMSQLEELSLDTMDIKCIDNIVTGMTVKECEDTLGRMTDWRKNIEVLASIRDVRLTTKPISCLTNLKTLRLLSIDPAFKVVGWRKKRVEITKLSYLMVLLNMDSLRCIDFGDGRLSPDYQLQPSGWKRVKEKFKILSTTSKSDVGFRP